MFQHRVAKHEVGKGLAIFNEVELVKSEEVVNDVDVLGLFNLLIVSHHLIRYLSRDWLKLDLKTAIF